MWRRGLSTWSPRWWALAITLLPLGAYAALQGHGDLPGKLRVRGFLIEPGEAGVTALRSFSQQWPLEPITLRAGAYVMSHTRAELGASMPTERLCARVLSLGLAQPAGIDVSALWARRGAAQELALSPVIVRSTLVFRLLELRRRVERLPVPGMVMGDGTVLAGIPGFTIDFASAIAAVEQALRSDETDVDLIGRNVPPPAAVRYGSDSIGRFTYRMVTFETKYRTAGPAAGRAHNVEMAAAHLDGVVIAPGGDLSFNAVVGERSYARGFRGAKEIAARRIVDGIGGGVCQVAATLHAAAFLGGFDLPLYQPHSRPAHYIELGLDTMVSWPAQDMRIANPYPFPVRVRAHAADGVLRISLEGAGQPHFVEWSTRILSRIKPGTQQILDPSLPTGESEQIQDAIDGLTVRRVRTIYLPSGPRREESILKYPPNDRIIAIGSSSSRAHRAGAKGERGASLAIEDF